MREPDPYLTPARVGLIMVAVLVFSVIFARIIAMREQADVRAEVRQESREPITLGIGGIRGLRGSLD
jgi:hypothetical protein